MYCFCRFQLYRVLFNYAYTDTLTTSLRQLYGGITGWCLRPVQFRTKQNCLSTLLTKQHAEICSGSSLFVERFVYSLPVSAQFNTNLPRLDHHAGTRRSLLQLVLFSYRHLIPLAPPTTEISLSGFEVSALFNSLFLTDHPSENFSSTLAL